MAKRARNSRVSAQPRGVLPRLKLFRPVSWYEWNPKATGSYISHLLMELGRLGLKIEDIESYSRPPHTKSVLSDLIDWLDDHPGEAFARLVDWQTLDLTLLQSRLEHDRDTKPRIEVSAHLTKMNNLSVRWHPGGWRSAQFDWHAVNRNYFNLITHMKWHQPPDFRWFTGDEDPTFDSRASNELMYIRGVGNLRPDPRDVYGPYATYNSDVVDLILICAVRAAYEELIRQLQRNFDVVIVDAFDFVVRDEMSDEDPSPYSAVRRVTAWSLEDAEELRLRREREAAAEKEEKERAELANLATSFGFAADVLIAAVLRATVKKATGPAPSAENVNRNAAKDLRDNGFKIDAGNVRRIRELIERFTPEILPASLQPEPPPIAPLPDNVVRLPTNTD